MADGNDDGLKRPLPEFIRLMDSTGTTVLDSVATEYEDSFCIESFGDLIQTAAQIEPAGIFHLTL